MTKKQPKPQPTPQEPAYMPAHEVKNVLYRLAESYHQLRLDKPLDETHKQSLRGGIDALVDADQLLDQVDPKMANGFRAVIIAEAAEKYSLHSKEARNYLSQMAAGFAEQAGLKPYNAAGNAPAGQQPQGYQLPPALAELLTKAELGGEKGQNKPYGQ